jgi:hypothetical protein
MSQWSTPIVARLQSSSSVQWLAPTPTETKQLQMLSNIRMEQQRNLQALKATLKKLQDEAPVAAAGSVGHRVPVQPTPSNDVQKSRTFVQDDQLDALIAIPPQLQKKPVAAQVSDKFTWFFSKESIGASTRVSWLPCSDAFSLEMDKFYKEVSSGIHSAVREIANEQHTYQVEFHEQAGRWVQINAKTGVRRHLGRLLQAAGPVQATAPINTNVPLLKYIESSLTATLLERQAATATHIKMLQHLLFQKSDGKLRGLPQVIPMDTTQENRSLLATYQARRNLMDDQTEVVCVVPAQDFTSFDLDPHAQGMDLRVLKKHTGSMMYTLPSVESKFRITSASGLYYLVRCCVGRIATARVGSSIFGPTRRKAADGYGSTRDPDTNEITVYSSDQIYVSHVIRV